MASLACLAVVLTGASLASARPAQALITPPVTVDGPSSAIAEFGGVSMASDGTGGLVYVKSVAGAPHVFASRFLKEGGRWSEPIRVDWDQPFEASQPAIAAGPRGELLVVWVTPVATVHGHLRYGLFSARIGPQAAGFGPSLPVDLDVNQTGAGVNPSVAATSAGKAIVAYRAITFDFVESPPLGTAPVQLRPGDVMAEIRVARLSGDRWARLGAVNRNPEASMRPPSPTNGPEVGVGSAGGAVVAWQEPDQTGAARIWMRRIFGNTPGQILEASPASWEGRPVSDDADALSLAVTPYTMARVAFRIARGAGALAGRLLVNTLPPNFSVTAGTLSGARLADGAAAGAGPPDVAIAEDDNRNATTRLAFLAGSRLRQMGGSAEDAVSAVASPGAPPGEPGAPPVIAVDPTGGGIVAYPALDAAGRQLLAVRQEFASGAAQAGLVSGAQAGPVADLAIGRSGRGDGLIAFLQGEIGRYQVVAERVSVPPAQFKVMAPKRWIRPGRARLRWAAAPSAVGGVSYSVLVDGRTVRAGLRRRVFRPPPARVGNGVLRARVLATDSLGQQVLSKAAKLRVDGQPPIVKVRSRGRRVTVRLRDRDSGLKAKATKVAFGEGARERGGSKFRYEYPGPGRHLVLVRARDEAGNRVARRFEVRVP